MMAFDMGQFPGWSQPWPWSGGLSCNIHIVATLWPDLDQDGAGPITALAMAELHARKMFIAGVGGPFDRANFLAARRFFCKAHPRCSRSGHNGQAEVTLK